MVHSERTRHMTKVVLDGLKDAEMQIGYAHEAMEAGDHEAAMLFRDEAEKRLDKAEEWYERMHREHGDEMDPGAYHAMKCHFKEWYHSMRERLEKMHE